MICPACGAEGAKGAAFCGSCGRPFGDYSVGAPAPLAAPAVVVPGSTAAMGPVTAYAGFWLRFVAHLIDSIIVFFAAAILFLLIFAVFGSSFMRAFGEPGKDPDPAAVAVFVAVLVGYFIFVIVGLWLHYAWLESSEKQATLGKMALGLIVTDLQGRRVSFGRASGRFFAKIVSGLIPFAIGYIMAGFTAKKQALHDMIASCLVLRKT
jgi:uncharacterized RDD family membrane protein YckC